VKALIATRHVDNPPRNTQPANAIRIRKVPRADPGKARCNRAGRRLRFGALSFGRPRYSLNARPQGPLREREAASDKGADDTYWYVKWSWDAALAAAVFAFIALLLTLGIGGK
jgi:hypothetical protein